MKKDIDKEIKELKAEIARLLQESTRPTCNDCGIELGDNWCADCAAKICLEKNTILEKQVIDYCHAINELRELIYTNGQQIAKLRAQIHRLRSK